MPEFDGLHAPQRIADSLRGSRFSRAGPAESKREARFIAFLAVDRICQAYLKQIGMTEVCPSDIELSELSAAPGSD